MRRYQILIDRTMPLDERGIAYRLTAVFLDQCQHALLMSIADECAVRHGIVSRDTLAATWEKITWGGQQHTLLSGFRALDTEYVRDHAPKRVFMFVTHTAPTGVLGGWLYDLPVYTYGLIAVIQNSSAGYSWKVILRNYHDVLVRVVTLHTNLLDIVQAVLCL